MAESMRNLALGNARDGPGCTLPRDPRGADREIGCTLMPRVAPAGRLAGSMMQ